uniref:Uncharacterized protein n=1 Tax=Sarcophilus harrisii TaxID=9305 RepID=A0A7N4PHV5_SARHA
MHGYQKCWSRDKNQLQGPKSDVRNREEVVVANIFASWLQSITDKIFLLISPHFFSSYNKNHDSKNEEDSNPDLPYAGGVFIYTPNEGMQCTPIHLLVFHFKYLP